LNVLGQSLTGDAEMEKALYFMVGVGGNNGKTLIFEALQGIMPNYVGEIDRKTFENGYSKAHKHLKNLRGKRIVYVEEMSGKEQNIEMLKQIGDGKVIKNECTEQMKRLM
jgi:phage/plasmid-associated DNA primase